MKTRIIICLSVLFLWLAFSSLANATSTMYAFWGTAAKDGAVVVIGFPCPLLIDSANSGTSTTGAAEASFYDVATGTWSRIMFSFNTSILTGQLVDSAVFRVAIPRYGKSADDWNTDLEFCFKDSWLHNPLLIADTLAYTCVTYDTLVLYVNLPTVTAHADSIQMRLRPSWVSTTGSTDIIVRSSKEDDFCAATGINNVLFGFTENGTTTLRPKLYVYTSPMPTVETKNPILYFPDEEEQ